MTYGEIPHPAPQNLAALAAMGIVRRLTEPCDCPVCEGSGYENIRATLLPHSDFGDRNAAAA